MKTDKLIVESGTAQIEPQFVVTRFSKLLCKANSFLKLHEALHQAEALEETIVNVKMRIEGYPLDCIVALNKAIDRTFGYVQALGGWEPPTRISIEIGYNRSETFAYGRLNPPAWERGYIDMTVPEDDPMSLLITGQIKRKFEPSITEVVALAKKIVIEESIYRHSAVELDLDYVEDVEEGNGFNPQKCAPKFIDVSNEVQLILPRDVEHELEADVWGVIERPDAMRKNGIPTKIGVLCSGPYGCGKTLMAAKTARIAAKHGYTYYYLKTPKQFVQAYRLAVKNGRSVLLVEDIDELFGRDRDHQMNNILETMDGIATKDCEVITVFTTNFPERINKAFMRSGRVDNHIRMRTLDAEAASRFIKLLADNKLASDVNYDEVGVAFRDFVAADIRGAISKAKKRAIKMFGDNITNKVSTELLVDAGDAMRKQRDLEHGDGKTIAERDLETVRDAHRIMYNGEIAVES
jgi:hypothetical protein